MALEKERSWEKMSSSKKAPCFFVVFFLCQPALSFCQRGVNLRLASSFGEAHREAIHFLNGIEGTFFFRVFFCY